MKQDCIKRIKPDDIIVSSAGFSYLCLSESTGAYLVRPLEGISNDIILWPYHYNCLKIIKAKPNEILHRKT